MSLSFWEKESFVKQYDFLIIGAGIVGLNTALALRQKYATAEIAILDRGWLPSGASTKNAGFACFGSAGEMLDEIARTSELEAVGLYEKRYLGIQKLLGRYGADRIGFQATGGMEVFSSRDSEDAVRVFNHLNGLNAMLRSVHGQEIGRAHV